MDDSAVRDSAKELDLDKTQAPYDSDEDLWDPEDDPSSFLGTTSYTNLDSISIQYYLRP
jgi:hypothetical protein